MAKRSERSSNTEAIVKEFAAIWLPLRVAESEILVPAIEDAELEAEKSAAVEVRIDIVGLLLADLIEEGGGSEQAQAKLEALSDALNAFVAASTKQREDLAEKSGFDQSAVGAQMSARYERAKGYFEDLDEAMDEAAGGIGAPLPVARRDASSGRKGGPHAKRRRMAQARNVVSIMDALRRSVAAGKREARRPKR